MSFGWLIAALLLAALAVFCWHIGRAEKRKCEERLAMCRRLDEMLGKLEDE